MLRLSSVKHEDEYYLGGLPGRLQYKKSREEIISLNLESNAESGYVLCEHSKENLNRLTPHTQRGKLGKILLIMKCEKDDELWLKGAFMNEKGEIALLTSTNLKINLTKENHRAVRTLDSSWYVGHYRMSAPVCFWNELKNRLLY
jgi:hypothetical protein